MKLKAVIFDLDNTLLDLMRMKSYCIDAAVDAMIDAGFSIQKKKALNILHKMYDTDIENQKIFQKFLRKTTGKVDPRILAYAILAYRRVKLGFLTPYPEAKQTLITIKETGLKLAVVSDAPREQAWQRLCALKLDDFFDVVVTFEDTKKHKPSKEPFLKALEKLKVKPEECLMVGDWPERDIVGAKKLGMKTAFAKYGNINHTGKKIADFKLDKISDLKSIIKILK